MLIERNIISCSQNDIPCIIKIRAGCHIVPCITLGRVHCVKYILYEWTCHLCYHWACIPCFVVFLQNNEHTWLYSADERTLAFISSIYAILKTPVALCLHSFVPSIFKDSLVLTNFKKHCGLRRNCSKKKFSLYPCLLTLYLIAISEVYIRFSLIVSEQEILKVKISGNRIRKRFVRLKNLTQRSHQSSQVLSRTPKQYNSFHKF